MLGMLAQIRDTYCRAKALTIPQTMPLTDLSATSLIWKAVGAAYTMNEETCLVRLAGHERIRDRWRLSAT